MLLALDLKAGRSVGESLEAVETGQLEGTLHHAREETNA
jgi:hypothetical protein